MKVLRLYTGEDGESHFADIEIELEDGGPIGKLSKKIKATGIIFRETPADYDYDWHNAPQRQFIIMLDAGVEITVSSGETRIVKAGEVLLVEDTKGRGHVSKALNNKPRKSVFITLD
ncbi:MAG: hypothetical protein A4E71_02481 [Smithella sp. PtaU1.Bin162]|jgi:hypothetical protein|nr:MAG: hypothetical protein A4E71_02481 [Smithella sp. PtaU1.Bin162]